MLSNQLYFYSDYDCASLNLIHMIDTKASNLSTFCAGALLGSYLICRAKQLWSVLSHTFKPRNGEVEAGIRQLVGNSENIPSVM